MLVCVCFFFSVAFLVKYLSPWLKGASNRMRRPCNVEECRAHRGHSRAARWIYSAANKNPYFLKTKTAVAKMVTFLASLKLSCQRTNKDRGQVENEFVRNKSYVKHAPLQPHREPNGIKRRERTSPSWPSPKTLAIVGSAIVTVCETMISVHKYLALFVWALITVTDSAFVKAQCAEGAWLRSWHLTLG